MSKKILFIGAGRMGGAILSYLLKQENSTDEYHVIDRNFKGKQHSFEDQCTMYNNLSECIKSGLIFDSLFIAIKPQFFSEISSLINSVVSKESIIISIMAGIDSRVVELALNKCNQIVRCMPNIGASLGVSTTVCYASDRVSVNSRKEITRIMSIVGSCHWVEKENLLHAVTAVSGSGPAYFFAFTEALSLAGIKEGLSSELALEIAIDTMVASAALLKEIKDPSLLIEKVTSPKGTTQAALSVFSENNNLANLIQIAVKSAVERSRELAF